MILDNHVLRSRRLAMNFTQKGLADELGVGSQTIKRLEDGGNDADLRLGFVQHLAELLDVGIHDLLPADSAAVAQPAVSASGQAQADALKVIAALHEAGRIVTLTVICQTFGWDRVRGMHALSAAREALAGTGLKMVTTSGGGFLLKPAGGGMTKDESRRLALAHLDEFGLTLTEAQILHKTIRGEIDSEWEGRQTGRERPYLYRLIKRELVFHNGERYQIHPDVAYSLGLEDLAT